MPKITNISIDTLDDDELKNEFKKLQEKLEHQRNLSRLRGARYYAKHGKIKDPADRKKPGRKPKNLK
jgi:hypothetical protein